ncbi:hypothetical protein Tsubulata_023662 [Turnera subulata]|uniref:Charged multivesicular body protein 5 n=1 Tax=Turnera subulata TaxID=218843 RepID=A0A9Q0F8Q2_9ROSI|nr:hypothetical protein Tsubulata_023662 [Turnera subulata]
MRRVFGVKKDKEPPPSIQDASERINKRGDTVDDKIKKLDAELTRYKEQLKKTRPGPAQEAIKARAMRVLKQKRMYEGQRDMLYNQTFNLDQVAFASEGIKDAQQTVCTIYTATLTKCRSIGLLDVHLEIFIFLGSAKKGKVQGCPGGTFSVLQMEPVAYLMRVVRNEEMMSALKSANKELKGMMKTVKIQDIDNLQDEMMDLMDVSNEIQETLGRSYNVPDDIDEDELLGELDALEADMGFETESDVPSYLQPDKEPDLESELNLPTAPTGHAAQPAGRAQAEDELGLPAVPRASIRG